tara:strand:- start:865 stop:1464 length:600 start_codon:yes stop_codon:yes gene_type:complete
MQKQVESYKSMYNFIQNYGRASKENSNCVKLPFFSQNHEKDENEVNNFKLNETNRILDFFVDMPIQLKNMYRIIGNPHIEYYFGEWILHSLINVQERLNIMLQEGNFNIVDFAVRNCGMGHCVICSYDPVDRKIFFRRDGGSNGYERVDNWNFIKSYKPDSEKKHNFSLWLDKIENEYDETEPNDQPWLYLQDPILINV